MSADPQSAGATPDATRWALLLDPGENLVWTGRPAGDLRFRRQDWVLIVIAGGLTILSGMVFFGDALHKAPAWFLALAAGMGILGVGLLPLIVLRDRARRRRTHYALTERRALILEGRKLRAYPLDQTNRLDIVAYGDRTSVYFKDEFISAGSARGRGSRTPPVEIGFEWISDGPTVHEHLRHLGAGRSVETTGVTWGTRV